jgi:hypothetical protein
VVLIDLSAVPIPGRSGLRSNNPTSDLGQKLTWVWPASMAGMCQWQTFKVADPRGIS